MVGVWRAGMGPYSLRGMRELAAGFVRSPEAPGQPPYRRARSAAEPVRRRFALPGRCTASVALNPDPSWYVPAWKPDADCGYLYKRRKFRLWPQLSTGRCCCGYVVCIAAFRLTTAIT